MAWKQQLAPKPAPAAAAAAPAGFAALNLAWDDNAAWLEQCKTGGVVSWYDAGLRLTDAFEGAPFVRVEDGAPDEADELRGRKDFFHGALGGQGDGGGVRRRAGSHHGAPVEALEASNDTPPCDALPRQRCVAGAFERNWLWQI